VHDHEELATRITHTLKHDHSPAVRGDDLDEVEKGVDPGGGGVEAGQRDR
jgi:hypothetical protein